MRWQDCKDSEDRRAWREERKDEALMMALDGERFAASYRKHGDAELAAKHAVTAARWRQEYERLKALNP